MKLILDLKSRGTVTSEGRLLKRPPNKQSKATVNQQGQTKSITYAGCTRDSHMVFYFIKIHRYNLFDMKISIVYHVCQPSQQ